jgi:hypothetical protein
MTAKTPAVRGLGGILAVLFEAYVGAWWNSVY